MDQETMPSRFCHRISLLLLAMLFGTGIVSLGLTASALESGGVVYSEAFQNWRDQSTDPGFNARANKRSKGIKISVVAGAPFGKAMSASDPITISVTPKTEVVFEISSLDRGARATLQIMNAFEPHDSYTVAQVKNQTGVFRQNLKELTGWDGVTSFWIEVWLEGPEANLTLKEVFIQDVNVAIQRKKEAAITKYTSREFAPAPGNSLFFDDFRKGLDGWRTEESDPGFSTELNFEEGVPRLKLVKGKGYGKLLSAVEGITLKITPGLEFEISLGDMGTSRVKVDLMTAQAPFDAHSVIPWVSEPGVYRGNIADATQWQGSKVFWIQLWIETTTRPDMEKGAVINYLRVNKK